MNEVVFPPVGECIYCRSVAPPLGKEHIIAFGFGGNLILPRASCTTCAAITGEVERFCLREMFGAYRIRMGMQSRRPKDRPTRLPIEFVPQDGERYSETVDAGSYPRICFGYRFPPPGLLIGEPESTPIDAKLVVMAFEPDFQQHVRPDSQLVLKLGAFNPLKFMRMLAKIAHAHAVAKVGLAGFKPLLPDLILGRTDQAGLLVGSDPLRPNDPPEPQLHDLYLEHVPGDEGTMLVVGIRLFSPLGMPNYYVTVGEVCQSAA